MMKKMTPVMLACMMVLAGCQSESETQTDTQARITHSVAVETIQPQAIESFAVVPGSVISDQQAKMASRLMGYIRDLDVHVGDYVKQGDVLFSIDPVDISSAATQAQAAVAQAEAALADAKLDYERFERLYKEGSVPKQQLDKMKLQYRVAEENVTKAKAALMQAEGQMRYADVRAPFDGTVVNKMAVAGDLAAPGHPVVVLENQNKMLVQVDVSQDVYNNLKLGDKVDVEIDGVAKRISGEVVRIVSAANPMTRSHIVKVKVNSEGLNSGTFARVFFPTGERQTILVPDSALIHRAGVLGVMVVDAKNVAHFRLVRVGESDKGQTEVLAGLLEGERYVPAGQDTILTGDLIK